MTETYEIKKNRALDLKDLQNRVYFIHITTSINELKKELKKHITPIYTRIYLIDNYLTDDSYARDPKLDATVLMALPKTKKCSLLLSNSPDFKPSFIKIDILEGTIQVIGDPYYVQKFNALEALI